MGDHRGDDERAVGDAGCAFICGPAVGLGSGAGGNVGGDEGVQAGGGEVGDGGKPGPARSAIAHFDDADYSHRLRPCPACQWIGVGAVRNRGFVDPH